MVIYPIQHGNAVLKCSHPTVISQNVLISPVIICMIYLSILVSKSVYNLLRSIDLDHDGFITVDELKLALADEVSSQNNELRLLMDSIDTDINGKINYTQFLASAIGQQELFRPQNLLKMFRLLDRNGNGEIETNEMVSFFSQNSIDKVNGKVVDEIIKSCDRDSSGTISFEEFQRAILF